MRVESYLESQNVFDSLSVVYVGKKARETAAFDLDQVQTGKKSFILKLRGIEDRDAAAKMVGESLWIPSESMEKLPEGEYYWHQIAGLHVVTEEGQALGTIASVFPTGSNDVYVCRNGESEILLPAIADVVKEIDMKRQVMVVRLMKGLRNHDPV